MFLQNEASGSPPKFLGRNLCPRVPRADSRPHFFPEVRLFWFASVPHGWRGETLALCPHPPGHCSFCVLHPGPACWPALVLWQRSGAYRAHMATLVEQQLQPGHGGTIHSLICQSSVVLSLRLAMTACKRQWPGCHHCQAPRGSSGAPPALPGLSQHHLQQSLHDILSVHVAD